ncbi:hypothetical protein QKA_2425 [Clostridioides difficile DA00165]|nr:hypothetical protein QKA_2425 [Clostridioides difficile DA00165]
MVKAAGKQRYQGAGSYCTISASKYGPSYLAALMTVRTSKGIIH